MSLVSQRKQVLLSGSFDATGKFSRDIYIPFQPDEMIVRSVNYFSQPDEDYLNFLWCDRVNEVIAVINDPCYYSPQTTFQLGKSINGQWNFEVRNHNGNLLITSNGMFGILLEFVKY